MMVNAAIPESVLERSGPSGHNQPAAGQGAGVGGLGAACAPAESCSVEPGAAPRRQKEIGGLPEKEPVRLPGRSPGNRVNYNRAVQISGTQATG